MSTPWIIAHRLGQPTSTAFSLPQHSDAYSYATRMESEGWIIDWVGNVAPCTKLFDLKEVPQ